jgi:hypothetical protein
MVCVAAGKRMYGTRQAARQLNVRISTGMDEHGYLAVNCENTIFMKHEGGEWIMHGLFVDGTIHASTSNDLPDKFIHEYKAEFDMTLEDVITLEDVMSSFLGMGIEHNKRDLTIHWICTFR